VVQAITAGDTSPFISLTVEADVSAKSIKIPASLLALIKIRHSGNRTELDRAGIAEISSMPAVGAYIKGRSDQLGL